MLALVSVLFAKAVNWSVVVHLTTDMPNSPASSDPSDADRCREILESVHRRGGAKVRLDGVLRPGVP